MSGPHWDKRVPILSYVEDTAEATHGLDEGNLANIARSYLSRRGLADTLKSFETEIDSPLEANTVYTEWIKEVEERKRVQLLCLQKAYKAAGDCLPPSSLLKVKLYCMESRNIADTSDALFYLTTEVGPLIPLCEDVALAHTVYTDYVSSLFDGEGSLPQESDAELAVGVNEALLKHKDPSGVAVARAWLAMQETVAPV
ncbi:hypothetical protein AGDE_04255 [Angomonas deanei]|nr:hypothetical protein AGDE_04255 [Angomonas deanei]|eukprot:EPY39673.1 hypothetical protein AGDE_04255 [Angomonas deanei]